MNAYTTDMQFGGRAAVEPDGDFIVAWTSHLQDGDFYGVFGQRFAASGAPRGAEVLEPGETVDVRPSWSNFSGAGQPFSGSLGNMTGPPGACHVLTDGTGDYGTAADGVTAACADCYAVSVSNPPVRPAVHWDASVVESILPAALGQKQWMLHVGNSFTDVPGISPYYLFIETLLHHSVTGGCSATAYCPAASTTRQMGVFLSVTFGLTLYDP